MTDGAPGEFVERRTERRSVELEMGILIQSVQTLTDEVTLLREQMLTINEWINQSKGARRIIMFSASSVGGVVGGIAAWLFQHFAK